MCFIHRVIVQWFDEFINLHCISKPMNHQNFILIPTGQWSEPITSGRINASVTFFAISGLAKK
jgi:hypothetical protein